MAENRDAIELPLVYIGAEDIPTFFANHFVVQHEENEFVLTVGQVQQPILLGGPDEQREQANKLSYIPIRAVAKVAFTRERMVALIEALQSNLHRHDSTFLQKEGD